MGLRNGRAQVLAAFALLAPPVVLAAADEVSAQGGDEVIMDPELAGSSASKKPSNGDEVISDPELGGSTSSSSGQSQDYGWGEVYDESHTEAKAPEQAAEEEDEHDPLSNTGIARLELLGQFGADMHHEGDLEDAYETRLRFGGEVELRRTRNLRVVIGSRVDFFWAVPAATDNVVVDRHERALDEDRFEVDVFATAAYVDSTLFDGFHLRIGQQVISLGRMDVYSPTDILAVYDFRPQPAVNLMANKLAQPAVRVDWDLNSWATLQAVYVPWFMPDLTRPNRDQYVAAVLGGPGAGNLPSNLSRLINPSQQVKAQEAMMRFVGPAPDFKTPQAQIRSNFRASSMEFGLNAGTALEKLPAAYITPSLNNYLINPNDTTALANVGQAMLNSQMVMDLQYHRYYLLGFDGSFDLSPVSVGFEFAYSPSRHMYAATMDGKHLAMPDVAPAITDPTQESATRWNPSNVTNKSIRKGVPLVQSAVHVEWLKGETFALVGEGFWLNALSLPHDKSRDWWGFIPKTGAYAGGLLTASYSMFDARLNVSMTSIVLVGPSFIGMPQVDFKVKEGVYVNAGAQIFEGPDPGLNARQNLNIGGLMSGYDQVFVGFRWLP